MSHWDPFDLDDDDLPGRRAEVPTYVYKCECGDSFEVYQRMADEPLEVCQCERGMRVSREITPVRSLFRGSGFYATDYKRTDSAE